MQIVIEIDEARYKDIQRISEVQLESNHFQTAEQIIAKGVPIEQEQKWIPVSDMPTKSGMYLVTRGIYMDVSEISYIIDFAYWHGHWSRGLVIAWMPLPQPYKADKED